jgi:hypothetical protein
MWLVPVAIAVLVALTVGVLIGQAGSRSDLTAVCTAVLALVAGVQALQSERYRGIVQRQYDLEMQPLLVWHLRVHFRNPETTSQEWYTVVAKNIGRTPAHRVATRSTGDPRGFNLREGQVDQVFPGCCARLGEVREGHRGRLIVTYADERGKRYLLEDSLQDVYASCKRACL